MDKTICQDCRAIIGRRPYFGGDGLLCSGCHVRERRAAWRDRKNVIDRLHWMAGWLGVEATA